MLFVTNDDNASVGRVAAVSDDAECKILGFPARRSVCSGRKSQVASAASVGSSLSAIECNGFLKMAISNASYFANRNVTPDLTWLSA